MSESDVEQIDIPFNAVIVQIKVVSETQRMMKNELLLDEYHFVRSIVFVYPTVGRSLSTKLMILPNK